MTIQRKVITLWADPPDFGACKRPAGRSPGGPFNADALRTAARRASDNPALLCGFAGFPGGAADR